MNDIREQIERLRHKASIFIAKDCHEAADTMEKLLQRNELLEAVYEAAKYARAEWDESEDSIDTETAMEALVQALAAVQTKQSYEHDPRQTALQKLTEQAEDRGDYARVCCYEHATDTERMTQMIVCNICGNKRCPKATDHSYECTDSNDLGQPGSRYE